MENPGREARRFGFGRSRSHGDAGTAPAPASVPDEKRRAWRDAEHWFKEHYDDAAQQVVDFLGGDGISLEGKQVADVGCGDGIIDLGVAHKAAPAMLTGFDLLPTDTDRLRRLAASMGAGEELPANLRFAQSAPTGLPAADDSFDVIFSWSTFEHVLRPVEMAREIRRVLKPDGVVMIQLWPFYHSEHGSHLWEWYPEGFVHLRELPDAIEAAVRGEPHPEPDWIDDRLEEFRTLNRITVDELQLALHSGGLRVAKLELLTHAIHIPPELAYVPLTRLGIAGVKMLAVPAG